LASFWGDWGEREKGEGGGKGELDGEILDVWGILGEGGDRLN